MKKRTLFVLPLFILLVLVSFPANADIVISFPFAFSDQFPGNSQPLGFNKGNLLSVGAFVISDYPISSVTAENLSSGLVLEATAADLGPVFPNLYTVLPLPLFNPEEHLGVWLITAVDVYENSANAQTHELDKEAIMPYAKEIMAFGDPLTPTITWKEPKEKFIPEWCILQYRIRLLTDSADQFYRSLPITYPFEHTIPLGVLTAEDFYDTWVRLESSCLDENDLSYPVPTEIRSETFRYLPDLLLERATP